MVSSINSLMNMEMQLYGGLGSNSAAPSYFNGYRAQSNNAIYSPSFYGYGNNGTIFGQNIPQQYKTETSNSSVPAGTPFKGLTDEQVNALTDYYAKNLDPSESFASAAIMGTAFGTIMANPRTLVHPWNSLTSFGDVKEMFKGVKENGSAMNKLWKENNVVMEEAYSQMQRAKARSKWKIGAFRKRYTKDEYNQLKKIMQEALDSKDINKIAESTESLRHAYSSNGFIPGLFDKICGKKSSTVASRLADTATITNNAKTLMGYNKMTLGNAFKKAGGKVGLVFGLLEIAMNISKIQAGYAKDEENAKLGIKSNNGGKQLAQTSVKAVCNTVGWAAGETLAIWGFAKAGAAIGTALGPGIGTIAGAAIGFLGGSIGMWLGGKLGKGLMGNDVSNKIEAEKLAQSSEGQVQLLQHALEQAQSGAKMDLRTQQALQSAITQLA